VKKEKTIHGKAGLGLPVGMPSFHEGDTLNTETPVGDFMRSLGAMFGLESFWSPDEELEERLTDQVKEKRSEEKCDMGLQVVAKKVENSNEVEAERKQWEKLYIEAKEDHVEPYHEIEHRKEEMNNGNGENSTSNALISHSDTQPHTSFMGFIFPL